MENYLLEINLISAQGLKPPSTNLRRMQTYAIAWIDPAFKLRTRVDRIGSENPTWNDKFIFRTTASFLSKETSAVTIEIYSVGTFKDPLIGTVRFLIGNCFTGQIASPGSEIAFGVPSFSALQIRRPSGRFQGVLNIGSMVLNATDTAFLSGMSAVGYQDLMGEKTRKRERSRRKVANKDEYTDENYCENSSCGDVSDADSSCSSSTTTTTTSSSTILKEWNGRRELAGIVGNKERFEGAGLLCGLGFQRKDSSESVRSEIAD